MLDLARTGTSEDGVHVRHVRADKECTRAVATMGVQNDTPIAWSADGGKLAYVAENCSIFITSDHKSRFTLEKCLDGHNRRVHALLFHPERPLLVSAGVEGIFVWDIEKGVLVQKIDQKSSSNAHSNGVECLTWVYGGSTLISGSRDHDIKVWDANSDFAYMETVHGHKAPVLTFSFCKEKGLLASAGRLGD